MKTLHIVRNSPFETTSMALAIEQAVPEDVLVLIDDGSYVLHHDLLQRALKLFNRVYVIDNHLKARALQVKSHPKLEVIEMTKFVELSFETNRSITWQ